MRVKKRDGELYRNASSRQTVCDKKYRLTISPSTYLSCKRLISSFRRSSVLSRRISSFAKPLFRAALTTTLHNPPNYRHRPYWLAPRYSKLTWPPRSLYKLRIGTALLLDSLPLKMGPIGYPETSVRIYHYSLRNNPAERRSCVHFLTKNDGTRIPLFSSREGRNWQHVIWLENQHTISIDNHGIRNVIRVRRRQNSCQFLLSHNMRMWFQGTDKGHH